MEIKESWLMVREIIICIFEYFAMFKQLPTSVILGGKIVT